MLDMILIRVSRRALDQVKNMYIMASSHIQGYQFVSAVCKSYEIPPIFMTPAHQHDGLAKCSAFSCSHLITEVEILILRKIAGVFQFKVKIY